MLQYFEGFVYVRARQQPIPHLSIQVLVIALILQTLHVQTIRAVVLAAPPTLACASQTPPLFTLFLHI
jgi:hypothetical protein